MKYIIIGLGNFGSVLADRFTQMGHEVVGVDRNIEKVEDIKSKISVALCLNVTDKTSLSVLPVKSVDGVIIALGKEFGESLMTYAIFKEFGVKKIVVRAISDIHAAVLYSLGVENIIFPEKDAAQKYAMSMELKGYVSSYKLDDENFIVEILAPKQLCDIEMAKINFKSDYNLNIIAVKREVEIKNILGVTHKEVQVVNSSDPGFTINIGDILVLQGEYKFISRFGS